MKPMNHALCPCHSAKPYGKCCEPYLTGSAKPRTVTQLMRSRYSAFAMGGCGDYLYHTWHPAERGTLTAEDLSVPTVEWVHLRIVDSEQKGDTGHVEFIATFLQEDGSAGTHHEKSLFVRERGQWLYHSGVVTTEV
ncbi:MAG: hypothetical protein A3H44_11430 [Gammaproteobacteria bacterium RIFCSPLOWO2_02_FULL_57_10]|nr:MAG: hypothetical protein A3H44_11430 [Gammaproteobacteria bacterium RIFCSPLOWO2_02_FULL_57_10]